MGGAHLHTRGKDVLQALSPDLFCRQELQRSSGHLVKHLAKPQANRWRPAKKRKGIVESKRASYKPFKCLDTLVWSLQKSKSSWTLSEDEICLQICLYVGFGKSLAIHAYRKHLMPLTRRSEVTRYRGCNSSTCYHEESGEKRIGVGWRLWISLKFKLWRWPTYSQLVGL